MGGCVWLIWQVLFLIIPDLRNFRQSGQDLEDLNEEESNSESDDQPSIVYPILRLRAKVRSLPISSFALVEIPRQGKANSPAVQPPSGPNIFEEDRRKENAANTQADRHWIELDQELYKRNTFHNSRRRLASVLPHKNMLVKFPIIYFPELHRVW